MGTAGDISNEQNYSINTVRGGLQLQTRVSKNLQNLQFDIMTLGYGTQIPSVSSHPQDDPKITGLLTHRALDLKQATYPKN